MSKKKKVRNSAPRIPFQKPNFKPVIGSAVNVENMMKWVRGLNPIEIELIHLYAKETYAPIINNFDLCSTAALVQRFEELSLDEICDFQKSVTDLMQEEVETEKELNKKGIDIMKNLKDKQPKITKDIEKMLNKGVKSQKNAIEELKMKYPTLSIASITNAYKRVKTEWLKAQEDKEVTDAVDYIFAEKEEVATTVEDKKEELKTVVIATVDDRKEEIKEIAERIDTLKIISRKIVVEGMFGHYEKDENGVRNGEEYWTSIEAVKADAIKKAGLEKDAIDKAREAIEKLKLEIESRENVMDNLTRKAVELEQVFAL